MAILFVSIAKAWTALSPLLYIFVGALLTRSWQRKQWLLDNKKAEFRELLSTLSESSHCILRNFPAEGFAGAKMSSGDELRQVREAAINGRRVIQDRIFIAKRIREENILDRWQSVTAEKDLSNFYRGMCELAAISH